MIERMTKYSFVLLASQKDEFLQSLQQLGVVDITRSDKPVDDRSAALLAEADVLSREIADISAGCDAHLTELRASLAELLKERDEIAPWGSWDRDLLQQLGVDLHFYIVDAISIAKSLGLGGRTNTVLQSAFFKLTGIIPEEHAIELMKDAAKKTYGRKGDDVVKKNWDAIDAGAKQVHEVKVPDSWKDAADEGLAGIEVQFLHLELAAFMHIDGVLVQQHRRREAVDLPDHAVMGRIGNINDDKILRRRGPE